MLRAHACCIIWDGGWVNTWLTNFNIFHIGTCGLFQGVLGWDITIHQGVEQMDRSEINRALAKAIAYKNCGKQEVAESWAIRLIALLECDGILSGDAVCKIINGEV